MVLAKSKFTLKLIGIMLDNNKTCLKIFNNQYYPRPPAATIRIPSTHINPKRSLDK
jgi:hypothetical protein